jgi:hypothetical protein
MSPGFKEAVRSQKVGAENAIVVQLPADRFLDKVQPHRSPPVDEQGRYCVMLLAQACARCSFGDDEAGPAQELHVWLQVGSSTEDPPIENADVMLPSQHWLALIAATDNPVVEANLRSFGFNPLRLASVDLQPGGGSLQLQEGASLEWSTTGPGRGPATIGVRHAMFLPDDEPDATGHRVAALISGAVMAQPGELRVQGSALEPFLLSDERLPALVHRMPELKADVVWRRRSKTP